MLNNEQTADKLQYILGTLHDGEKGYQEAAENATDPQLKSLLMDLGNQRTQMARQIDDVLSGMGEKPRQSGSVGAALHRTWLNVRDAVTGKDDYAVIAEAERGENAAVDNYQDVLKEELPSDVQGLLQRQYDEVLASRDRIVNLKNTMDASRNLKS